MKISSVGFARNSISQKQNNNKQQTQSHPSFGRLGVGITPFLEENAWGVLQQSQFRGLNSLAEKMPMLKTHPLFVNIIKGKILLTETLPKVGEILPRAHTVKSAQNGNVATKVNSIITDLEKYDELLADLPAPKETLEKWESSTIKALLNGEYKDYNGPIFEKMNEYHNMIDDAIKKADPPVKDTETKTEMTKNYFYAKMELNKFFDKKDYTVL